MRKIVTIISWIFCAALLSAQQLKVYNDDFGIKGEVRTSEVFEEGILPENGVLDIRWREIKNNNLYTYRIKGNTKKQTLEGRWLWEAGKWNYAVNAGTSIQPQFLAAGKRKKWEGSFIQGKPNGKWIFLLDTLSSDGRVIQNLIRIEIQYKKGIPVGNFLLDNKQTNSELKVVGICDEKGLANGNWLYTYKNKQGKTIRETRSYQQGLLTEIKIQDGSKTTIEKQEHNLQFIKNQKNLPNIRIGKELFTQDEKTSDETGFLAYSLQRYFLSGWRLEIVGAEVDFQIPHYVQLEYLLSADELEQISLIRSKIQEENAIIENHMQGNSFVQRHRNEQIDTSLAYLELMQKQYQFIDSLLLQTHQPSFNYANRNNATFKKWQTELQNTRQKKGEIFQQLDVSLNGIAFDSTSSFLSSIEKYLNEQKNKVQPYYKNIEEETIAIQQEGILKDLSELIEDRFKKVEHLYVGKFGVAQDIDEQLIKGTAHKLIQEFSRAETYQQANTIGHEILQLLDSLETWNRQTELFDNMEQNLRTQYRYLAYNPYTGENNIEIKIKKRFLNTILSDLWPYLNVELKNTTTLKEWSAIWHHYFDVYHYLMNFAKRDDKQADRIEKRIRKEKKSERILRMILNQIESDNIDALIGEKKTN